MKNDGAFRFTYFTDLFENTCSFYNEVLEFKLEHAWDRSDHDKGALFKAGAGLIEVLLLPDEEFRYAGLDYRQPQGAFMGIQVWNIDELFHKYSAAEVSFKQELTEQPWGHRSFSVIEPNGLILFFFQEQF
ncbi:VOC family protein [Balneola sp. MJW-20]|uniref:VOC family protein n=1 Tax=Gracilimonas aurantiaca TaxID=3234185 RepID=UPI003465E2A9